MVEQFGGSRPAYALRLANLLERRATLTAGCQTCGHSLPIDPVWTLERHGNLKITELEGKLYCVPCRRARRSSLVKVRVEWGAARS